MKAFFRPAVFVLVANVLAGGLHYLFQVVAAKKLSLSDLGKLNVWISSLTLLLLVGVVLQAWVVLMSARFEETTWKRLKWGTLLAAVSIAIALNSGMAFLLLPLAFMISLLGSFWLGAAQARQRYWVFGAMTLAMAGGKVLFAGFAVTSRDLMTAVAYGPLAALAVALFYEGFLSPRRSAHVPLQGRHAAEWAIQPLLLALMTATVWALPASSDTLLVSTLMAPEEVGHLNRLQLFSKVLFFLPATVIQITFPKHVQGESRHLRWFEGGVWLLCLLIAVIFGWVGPWVARAWLGFTDFSLEGGLIFLACVTMLSWYGLLSSAQYVAAKRDSKRMVAILALAVLPLLLLLLIWPGQLYEFLAWEAGLVLLASLISMRIAW